LSLQLAQPLAQVPATLHTYDLRLSEDGHELVYTYDSSRQDRDIATLLNDLQQAGVQFSDLQTRQSSLEDIFVSLVKDAA